MGHELHPSQASEGSVPLFFKELLHLTGELTLAAIALAATLGAHLNRTPEDDLLDDIFEL